MKLSIFRITWVVIFICLSGCNNQGAPAAAPTNVTVVPGDTTATVTWDIVPGVQYFAWWAPEASLSPEGCASIPSCRAATYVTSPYVITGLTNGTTYSVTINGRTGGGVGGAGSPSKQVTPRLAGTGASGATWTYGSSLGQNLYGVVYGNNQYVATGANGALYSSADGISWSSQANRLPGSTTFNAITNFNTAFLVVGAGGAIWQSTDSGVTWVGEPSGTSNELFAIAGNAADSFIAVGANGTIRTSNVGGTTWTQDAVSPATSNTFYGLTYGVNGRYVAVGAGGIIYTSTDAVTWQSVSSPVTTDLRSVVSGTVLATGLVTFVAVGNNGVVITSSDGLTWTQVTSLGSGTNQLKAVTFGNQFIAVDDGGNIYTSTNGLTWGASAQTASAGLNALAHSPAQPFTYSAVGVGGLNIHAM